MAFSPRLLLRTTAFGLAFGFVLAACFDSGVRWEKLDPPPPPPPVCTLGEERCGIVLERCQDGPSGAAWAVEDDCAAKGEVCTPGMKRCTPCLPSSTSCKGLDVITCTDDGMKATVQSTCDSAGGQACRGGSCVDLCALAATQRSNVGCEYWAVDLDNAMISATSNAAAQQFAIVVSNPQSDVPVDVHITIDDGAPGSPSAPVEVATATIAALNLQVFKLGPREVDGSAEGTFNTGTHTALTRHAYKITSNFPVVAYQFNPLDNVNVFSNDASLLKPVEALIPDSAALSPAYVVAGWPQTIAVTDDPNTNFSPSFPIQLRAFLTIVGTRPGTHVSVTTTTAVVPGGPVSATPSGGTLEATLDAYDVLNLETGDFLADFTGSIVSADGPVAVFSGTEASDAPTFKQLSERRCCADHLEEQLDPMRAAGQSFVLAHTPSRTAAVRAAGANIGIAPEPEYFRFVNATHHAAVIKTTLPAPDDVFQLNYLGEWREVTATHEFVAEASSPVHVGQVMASQDAANVKRGLPGGDPSLLVPPPVEQYRPDYVFLTPDKYAFDFISVVAKPNAIVMLDGSAIGPDRCAVLPGDGLTSDQRGSPTPPWLVYQCQLSFPIIDPLKTAPDNVAPGIQHDGVHRVIADSPIGVLVSGFDNYVSYAYAAGTELRQIAPPQ